jgi:hypothetical protein
MAERPVLSPSNILTQKLSHKENKKKKKKYGLCLKNYFFFISGLFKSYLILKLRKLKLRKSGSVRYVPVRAVPF